MVLGNLILKTQNVYYTLKVGRLHKNGFVNCWHDKVLVLYITSYTTIIAFHEIIVIIINKVW